MTGPVRAGGVLLLAAGLLAASACGIALHHSATFGDTPTRCADGLPARVLQALTCPNGYCGFSCQPGRWEAKPCQ